MLPRMKVTPEPWRMSICPYCGVGCGVEVGVRNGEAVAVRGMTDHPVNRGELCHLGHNLIGVLDTEGRLLHPMVRRPPEAELERTSWDDATTTVADRMTELIGRHGPDTFAMYISASEYIEEYYVYNKFVKGCLGTNNLESSARLCWASGVAGLVQAFGADSPPCAYEDFDHADLFFVAGYNLAESKPVLFQRMMRARAAKGTRMIVVDPRRTATAARADVHLMIRPGTDVALHNAIAQVLIRRELIDEQRARSLVDDFDGFAAHVDRYPPDRAAEITGLSASAIVEAARIVAEAPAGLFLWGQGLNQSSIGTRKVSTLLNLVFLTDNIGKPGAGPMAVTGQTSAMGLREVGALPNLLPGFRTVTDPRDRTTIADLWGVPRDRISARPGRMLPDILAGIDAGSIRALWVIHSNPAATFPDTSWVRSVLSKLELLVVQDCYHPTETSELAHVLLPGAQWAEKGGTMTNSERGLNLVEPAVAPPGEAKPDLEIVMDVAAKMGFGAQFSYRDTEAIFEEYKRATAGRPCDIRGVSYDRLRSDKGIQWPVPNAAHSGTKRRFVDRSFPRGTLTLGAHEHEEPDERVDEEFPLLLITGLVRTQFHSRTRTGKIAAMQRATPAPFVEINPADAAAFEIVDGACITVRSRRGSVLACARVTDAIRRGAVFMPYHFGALAGRDCDVNALTIRAFDEVAKQPEYKACAVRVEAARGQPDQA